MIVEREKKPSCSHQNVRYQSAIQYATNPMPYVGTQHLLVKENNRNILTKPTKCPNRYTDYAVLNNFVRFPETQAGFDYWPRYHESWSILQDRSSSGR
jgi:hypothetical protein